MTTYQTVAYLQGDDYVEAMTASGGEVGMSVIHTRETWDALYDHLMQWEYGEPTEEYATPPWGGLDDVDESHPGYVVSWNWSLGYCSLTRVIGDDDGS